MANLAIISDMCKIIVFTKASRHLHVGVARVIVELFHVFFYLAGSGLAFVVGIGRGALPI